MSYKEVPIKAAEEIAKKFEKQEVIVLSVDRPHNKVHITTYGINKDYCKNAEITGDFLAEILQLNDSKLFTELIEQVKEKYLKSREKANGSNRS